MVLPAPGRFSTTTCCPSARVSRTPIARQMMSGVPPAACVTIILIGRVGQLCAPASPEASAGSSANAAAIKVFIVPPSGARRRAHELDRLPFADRIVGAEDDLARTHALDQVAQHVVVVDAAVVVELAQV